MKFMNKCLVLLIGSAVLFAACKQEKKTRTPRNLPQGQLTKIEIFPDDMSLVVGEAEELLVSAVYSDGSEVDITPDVKVTNSDSAVATVVDNYYLEAKKPGSNEITVEFQGKSAKAVATVKELLVTSLYFEDLPETFQMGVKPTEVVLVGVLADGSVLEVSDIAEIKSSNPQSVDIKRDDEKFPMLAFQSTGKTTLTATLQGKTITKTITVSPTPGNP